MTDEKKAPPANIDDLKARLGLGKKDDKGAAHPVGPVLTPAPGLKPPVGVTPPPFLQTPKPTADHHRDPFAANVGGEMTRESLIHGPRTEEMAVHIDDHRKMTKQARRWTIIISVIVGLILLPVGVFWGRGFSSRLIYNRSVEDGKVLYDTLQGSAQIFSGLRTKLVSAQQKASKDMVADFALGTDMQKLVESNGCVKTGEKETCILRLQDLANRAYNIYKPEIVQMLFTYASQWNELLRLMDDHAVRTKNDKAALDETKTHIEKLTTTDYGLIFTMRTDPQTSVASLYGNLVVIASALEKEGQITGYKLQAGLGYPSVEKKLYVSGDLAAEPDAYVLPLGTESKEVVMGRMQISHFIEYKVRIQTMIELANKMDQNQKSLMISIGEIASLDKQFAF